MWFTFGWALSNCSTIFTLLSLTWNGAPNKVFSVLWHSHSFESTFSSKTTSSGCRNFVCLKYSSCAFLKTLYLQTRPYLFTLIILFQRGRGFRLFLVVLNRATERRSSSTIFVTTSPFNEHTFPVSISCDFSYAYRAAHCGTPNEILLRNALTTTATFGNRLLIFSPGLKILLSFVLPIDIRAIFTRF